MVIDFDGKHRVQMQSEEAIKTISLDKQSLLEYREKFPAYLDADKYDLTL